MKEAKDMKEGWEYKKLGEVADFYRGLTYGKQDEAISSDVCVLRSNNIDMESMSLNFDEIKYLSPDFVIPEDKKLKGNSIFICMSNGSKQHVGKVAFVENDMDYAFGGFMGLITPSKEVSAKYVYYACRSPLYRVFLTSIGNGIGITNLKFTDLYNFSFPMPKLSHQQQIVSELDLLSGVIEKQKAKIEKLTNKKKLYKQKLALLEKENKKLNKKLEEYTSNQEQLILLIKLIQSCGVDINELIDDYQNSTNININNTVKKDKKSKFSDSVSDLDIKGESNSFIPITIEKTHESKISKIKIPKLNFEKINKYNEINNYK